MKNAGVWSERKCGTHQCTLQHVQNREGKLRDRVREAGREWRLMGILGTEGEGVRATRKAILKYLSETGLIGIIPQVVIG